MSENGGNRTGADGAYQDEMATHLDDGSVITFERVLRDTFVRPPAAELAERHLAKILAESRRARVQAPRELPETHSARRRRGPALALRLAALALAAFVLTAGLALAGVQPPEPVADMLESIGLNVPGDDRPRDIGTPEEAGGSIAAPGDDPHAEPPPGSELEQGGRDGRATGLESSRGRHVARASPERPRRARRGSAGGGGRATNPGRSEDAGRPASPGHSEDAGRPESPGHSEDAGPPASPGAPSDHSPPPSAGPPAHSSAPQGAGPPVNAGASNGQPPPPPAGGPHPPAGPPAGHGPP